MDRWQLVSDSLVRMVWKHPITGDRITTDPDYGANEGVPIDPEIDMEYEYVGVEFNMGSISYAT